MVTHDQGMEPGRFKPLRQAQPGRQISWLSLHAHRDRRHDPNLPAAFPQRQQLDARRTNKLPASFPSSHRRRTPGEWPPGQWSIACDGPQGRHWPGGCEPDNRQPRKTAEPAPDRASPMTV